ELSVRRICPLSTSHNLSSPSLPPDSRRVPSGLKSNPKTALPWRPKLNLSAPFSARHSLTESCTTVARNCPSGEKIARVAAPRPPWRRTSSPVEESKTSSEPSEATQAIRLESGEK